MDDKELTLAILREIDTLLKSGVLPVSVDHLKHLCPQGDALECLIAMKHEGLISGDLVTIGASSTPHRVTNIRLTYLGIRTLTQKPGSDQSPRR
jgi:hypothetical protein